MAHAGWLADTTHTPILVKGAVVRGRLQFPKLNLITGEKVLCPDVPLFSHWVAVVVVLGSIPDELVSWL